MIIGSPLIASPALGAMDGIRHGFFTRRGGVSHGLYASLNCGPGSRDDPDAVSENRARAMTTLELPADALATLYQVHSGDVVTIEAPFAAEARPRADAMVSRRPGIALGILTADCVPVLMADGEAGVIGAAHAGWKGALSGVVDKTLAAMEALGARRSRIVCAVGPCIRQGSYEVGPEFPAAFLAERPENEAFFAESDRPGHHRFDLAGYVRMRLQQCTVGTIDDVGLDTRDDDRRFFSYRRCCLRGEADYGRQLSAIALAPE